MKLQLVKPPTAATIGLVLAAPAAYFIFVAVLKYVFGLSALFDGIEPLMNSLGAKESLGWNINLLILFGPLLALLINLSSILSVSWKKNDDAFDVNFSIGRRTANWIAIIMSGGSLAILFFYAIGENCNC